jgi:hypothetical protein
MRKLLGIYTSVMFCFLGMSAQTMAALDGGTPTWCDDLQIRTANLTTAVQSERGFQKELRDTVESLQGVCASVSEAKEFEVDVLMRALVMAEMLSSTANIEIIDSMRTYGIIRDSFTIRSLQPIFLALIALTRHQKISTEGKVAGTVSVLFYKSCVRGSFFFIFDTTKEEYEPVF